ncbi:MAG TPA: RNA methyltransferase [Acidobacteriaceae bacterium]
MPASVITSRANPRVKQLRAAFAGNARLADGLVARLVAIEGENLIREAIRSNITFHTIFLSEHMDAPAWLPHGVEILHLADDIFSSAMDTQAPQGIAALIETPQWQLVSVLNKNSVDAAPLFLIAAGLQDPGNLGTLIRSAEAFGANAVLTTNGTVSPWNQKALRASAGSVFRVPVISIDANDLATLKTRGIQLLAAVAPETDHTLRNGTRAERPSHAMPDLTQPTALIIGNEGAGVSPEFLALADARISIPTPGPVESLNAAIAGSLLLYEAARQRQTSRTLNHEPRT